MEGMHRWLLALFFLSPCLRAAEPTLALTLQTRTPGGAVRQASEVWPASRTAVIVCDMWDAHHCRNAVLRASALAPRLHAVLEKLRDQGALVVHAPSGCMAAYEGTPARERPRTAPRTETLPAGIDQWCKRLPSEEGSAFPIDDSDGGGDDDPSSRAAWIAELEGRKLDPRAPWTRQMEAIRIDQERDAISDSGPEIWNLLEARGIDRVILAGVHVNFCVPGRPFGLRQMVRNGKRAVLLRDLTDSMYNPRRWPFVSHEEGTARVIAALETRVCPTITSDQILGGPPFAMPSVVPGEKRWRILLLGDSTTEASIPKLLAPEEPQVEDTLRILLALEPGLPPTDVVNLGQSGEFIRRLLDSGRYEKQVASQPDADFIVIRYGWNDAAKRENFDANFPEDFRELLARLRQDHPGALLIPSSVIPFGSEAASARINGLVRQVAESGGLPYFDIYPRYQAELEKGPDMLNYRRYSLSKVPEALRPLATPYLRPGEDPQIVVLDNRLDALFGHLPGWFGDRHPNLAGYQVIARETARFLAPLLRQRSAS